MTQETSETCSMQSRKGNRCVKEGTFKIVTPAEHGDLFERYFSCSLHLGQLSVHLLKKKNRMLVTTPL